MQIIREIENFKPGHHPLYLALGNFDGLHQGHQRLIRTMVAAARSDSGKATAFVFEPHPSKVLFPERNLKLLVTAERKAELMEKLGVQILIYNSFNFKIARCSPEQFVQQILIDQLRVKEVFVGFNYTFGYKGAGTPELLWQLGEKQGFKVNIIPPVAVDGRIVSSSMIRRALDAGDIGQAKIMLGYEPMLEGQVVEGEHRGSSIGFPTANLGLSNEISIPGKGVYAARAEINGSNYQAVVNIGSKPTFHAQYPVEIEAHLIDFTGDIYGQRLRLYFITKIRDERKFSSVEELTRQIALDRDKARRIALVR